MVKLLRILFVEGWRGRRVGYIPPWFFWLLLLPFGLLTWIAASAFPAHAAEDAYKAAQAELAAWETEHSESFWSGTIDPDKYWEVHNQITPFILEIHRTNSLRAPTYLRPGTTDFYMALFISVFPSTFLALIIYLLAMFNSFRVRRLLANKGYVWIDRNDASELSWSPRDSVRVKWLPPAEEIEVIPDFGRDIQGIRDAMNVWRSAKTRSSLLDPLSLHSNTYGYVPGGIVFFAVLGVAGIVASIPFRVWLHSEGSRRDSLIALTRVEFFDVPMGYETFLALTLTVPAFVWLLFLLLVHVLFRRLKRLGYDWVFLPDLARVCIQRGVAWVFDLPNAAAFDAYEHRPREAEELPRFARAAAQQASSS